MDKNTGGMSLIGRKIMEQMNKIGEPRTATTTTTMDVPKPSIDFGQLGMLLAMMLSQGQQPGTEKLLETPVPPGRTVPMPSGAGVQGAGMASGGGGGVSPLGDMSPAQISSLLSGVTGMPSGTGSGLGNPEILKHLLSLMGGDR